MRTASAPGGCRVAVLIALCHWLTSAQNNAADDAVRAILRVLAVATAGVEQAWIDLI